MGLLFLNLSALRDVSRIVKTLAKMTAEAESRFRLVTVSVLLFYVGSIDHSLVWGFIVSRVPFTRPLIADDFGIPATACNSPCHEKE